jgi:hypothetical protein
MRILKILGLCAALGGCAGSTQSPQGIPVRSGDRFIGQNVDALVAQIGRPTSSKRIDDGQASYVWELAARTGEAANQRIQTADGGLYGDGSTPGYISDDPRLCKISVVTSPEGTITKLTAEDSNGTGAPALTVGLSKSICAQRLGAKS